jgi:ribose transport system permease protein
MNAMTPTVAVETAPSDEGRRRSGASSTYLLVPILLLFALLLTAVIRSPNLVSHVGIGSAVIVAGPLILATYALMASTMAGRGTVDLSIGPLIGFINVTLVQLYGAGYLQSPVTFVLYALAVGVAYQVLMALIVIFVRVQPIIVALSGYLALSGINLVILPRPGGIAPDWMQTWGAGTEILSPVLFILVLATGGWLIFTRSAFYLHLRLMGSDERAAYTSGVRITVVRIGAHVISGIFAAMSALCFTALISSGDPNQGTTYTLVAVTALVLGGASLAGGRGSVFGSMFGAMNLYLITYVLATFSFGSVQSFVTDLAYGTILVLSLLVTVILPYFQRWLQHVSPLLFFVILSIGTLGVILHVTFDYAALKPAASAAAPAGADGLTRLGGEAPAAPAASDAFALPEEPAPPAAPSAEFALPDDGAPAPAAPSAEFSLPDDSAPAAAPSAEFTLPDDSAPAPAAPSSEFTLPDDTAPAQAPAAPSSEFTLPDDSAPAPAPAAPSSEFTLPDDTAPAPAPAAPSSEFTLPDDSAPAPAPAAPSSEFTLLDDSAPAPAPAAPSSEFTLPDDSAPAPAPAAPSSEFTLPDDSAPAPAPAAPSAEFTLPDDSAPAPAPAPAASGEDGLSIQGAPPAAGGAVEGLRELAPAAPAEAPAASMPRERTDPAVFLFETVPADPVTGVAVPDRLREMVFLAILLLAIPVLLRTLVTQSGRRASLTLPVFVVAIAVVLLGVYFARVHGGDGGSASPEIGEGTP